MKKLPNWLSFWIWRALIGEVYPNLRAVAAAFSGEKVVTLRYYLDRPPEEEDHISLAAVGAKILANTSHKAEIAGVRRECVFSTETIEDLEPLDGLLYARKERSGPPAPGTRGL